MRRARDLLTGPRVPCTPVRAKCARPHRAARSHPLVARLLPL